ncbi:hypothetical protein BN59_03155 [Legionella massiliensis]|uniref:Uncharacterized protein n=1 Tax=Legionella massiliensis TaxID=1034943 RepID=A0A078L0Z8_9GAMM|nr:hypothetical protein [Legionella massiliensis]CDZ78841.1 hypothetical protein BN59_03155 [Legionella massiliensis]CEE14579.1 hypothetical protein BN1094_03155 [Legionella massiliensis]
MRYSDFRKMLQTIIAEQLDKNQCPNPIFLLKELLQTYLSRLPQGQTLFAPAIKEIQFFNAQLTDQTSLDELVKLLEDYYLCQANPREPNALKACFMAFFHYYRFSFNRTLLLESEIIVKYILLPLSLHSRDKRDSVVSSWLEQEGMFNIAQFIIPETSRKAVMDRLREEFDDIESLEGAFPTLSDTEQEEIIKTLVAKCDKGKSQERNYIYCYILSAIRIPTTYVETVAKHQLKILLDHKRVKYIDKVLFRPDILPLVLEELIQFLLDELESKDKERLSTAIELLTNLLSQPVLISEEVHSTLQEKCLAQLQTYKALQPSELKTQDDSVTKLLQLMAKLNFSEPQPPRHVQCLPQKGWDSQELITTLLTMLSSDSLLIQCYALRLLASSMQNRLLSTAQVRLLITHYSSNQNGAIRQEIGQVLTVAMISDAMIKEFLAQLVAEINRPEMDYYSARDLNHFLSSKRNTQLKLDFLGEWIPHLVSEDEQLRKTACALIKEMRDIPATLAQLLIDIAQNKLYPEAQNAAREALTRIKAAPKELQASVYLAAIAGQRGDSLLKTVNQLVIPENYQLSMISNCRDQIIQMIKARRLRSDHSFLTFTQIANSTSDKEIQRESVVALFRIIALYNYNGTLEAVSCLSLIKPLSLELRYEIIFALLKLINHGSQDPNLRVLVTGQLLLERQFKALNNMLLGCNDSSMHGFILASLEKMQASVAPYSDTWFTLEKFIQQVEIEMPLLPEMFRQLPTEVNERIIAAQAGA